MGDVAGELARLESASPRRGPPPRPWAIARTPPRSPSAAAAKRPSPSQRRRRAAAPGAGQAIERRATASATDAAISEPPRRQGAATAAEVAVDVRRAVRTLGNVQPEQPPPPRRVTAPPRFAGALGPSIWSSARVSSERPAIGAMVGVVEHSSAANSGPSRRRQRRDRKQFESGAPSPPVPPTEDNQQRDQPAGSCPTIAGSYLTLRARLGPSGTVVDTTASISTASKRDARSSVPARLIPRGGMRHLRKVCAIRQPNGSLRDRASQPR